MRNPIFIPSLDDYAKEKKKKKKNFDIVNCLECRCCIPSLKACIFGKNVRDLSYVSICPKSFKK